MTQSQKGIYKELEMQGMPKAGCRFIAQQFNNEEQEHMMMEYLISIREKHISVTEVSKMVEQIQTM